MTKRCPPRGARRRQRSSTTPSPCRGSNGLVVGVEQITPSLIAQFSRSLGGADDTGANDIGEQDRGKHPVSLGSMAGAGQERLGLVHYGVTVTDVHQVVLARKLDQLGPGNVVAEVTGV